MRKIKTYQGLETRRVSSPPVVAAAAVIAAVVAAAAAAVSVVVVVVSGGVHVAWACFHRRRLPTPSLSRIL